MTLLHEKSPCCRGNIIRFGRRRRQCCVCRKTWRVWQRKRGRKHGRPNIKALIDFLDGHFVSIRLETNRRRLSESALRRRLHYVAEHFVDKTDYSRLNQNSSGILLADAFIKRIQRKWWTVYLMAIKQPHQSTATLLPPLMREGRESFYGWYEALNSIPLNTRSNIKVMVSDGHRGLAHYARLSNWLTQRCQAHIIFALAGRRSRSQWSLHRKEGERIYQLTKIILNTKDQNRLINAINEIETMGWETSSRSLKTIISGFVDAVDDYRTCIIHPELNIPNTNNALESLISQFEEICHRSHGFSTSASLKLWITAFVKHKQLITCNGFYQPNKRR